MCCLKVRSLNIFRLEKRVASTRQKETFRLRWRHHENKINLMQPEENKQKNLHSGVIRFSVSS